MSYGKLCAPSLDKIMSSYASQTILFPRDLPALISVLQRQSPLKRLDRGYHLNFVSLVEIEFTFLNTFISNYNALSYSAQQEPPCQIVHHH